MGRKELRNQKPRSIEEIVKAAALPRKRMRGLDLV
jgi:hypothetical protein